MRSQSGICLTQPDWEWADVDGSRLFWAESGRLWTGSLAASGLVDRCSLHDFSNMSFERRPALY